MPKRQGEPEVSGSSTKHALGQQLYLCLDRCPADDACIDERDGRASFMWLLSSTHLRTKSLAGVFPAHQRQISCSPLMHVNMHCRATDALEQALHDRRPVHKGGLIHHSDRGGQYLSIRYTERLALAGTALEDVSGVKGTKFRHSARFIAVASTREAFLMVMDTVGEGNTPYKPNYLEER